MSTLNKELVKEVIAFMRKYPFDVEMAHWLGADGASISSCGTTGCIAGIACFLTDEKKPETLNQFAKNRTTLDEAIYDIPSRAKKLLRLEYSDNVFQEAEWPYPFDSQMHDARMDYMMARDCQEKSKLRKKMTNITIARLEHLLEHGE